MPKPVAIAMGAHPEDIEFYMTGTHACPEGLVTVIDNSNKACIRTI